MAAYYSQGSNTQGVELKVQELIIAINDPIITVVNTVSASTVTIDMGESINEVREALYVSDAAGTIVPITYANRTITDNTVALKVPIGSFGAPALGTSGGFGVIASTTITSTGSTTINGSLALYPGTSVTGSPTVTGATHIADSSANIAKQNAQTAYNTLAALPAGTTVTAGATGLNGLTLGAGVYTSASTMGLTTGLTLSGGASDVWIFQVGSSLTIGNSATITLSGGALAGNVFWQVGSSTTIGTSVAMKGTIINNTSATLTTSATLAGRVFALNGAVTMDTNTITVPVTAGSGFATGDIIILEVVLNS